MAETMSTGRRGVAGRGTRHGLWAVFLFGLLLAPAPALAEANVLVVEDDGTIFEPARPAPFSGRRLIFEPAGAGYTTRVLEGVAPAILGAPLQISGRGEAVGLTLARPIPLYGRLYRDLFVHPQGAISYGSALPDAAGAGAERPAEGIASLSSGPPTLAVLWNDLRPGEAADARAGIYVAELNDRVLVTWVRIPSVRPAGEGNTFRAVLFRDGRIEFEYPRLPAAWGVVGITPGVERIATDMIDLQLEPPVEPRRAVFAWYRDRPRLNEVALARRLYRQAPDDFDFLAVFTDRVVDGEHLVGSMTVSNEISGIGMPFFDHGALFGSETLEHIILMNSVDLYADDPRNPPEIPGYAFAPSTLAVLGHEMGHRWLAHASEPLSPSGQHGHWSFFLHSDGSVMGGSRLVDNDDGTFTTENVMSGFGDLDQYLMGVRAPEEVGDFFVVEEPRGLEESASAPPRAGVTFEGVRRDLGIEQVIDELGERAPEATTGTWFRMGYVLVTGQGVEANAGDLAKVERVRRRFGSFFRAATGGRARVWSRVDTSRRPPRLAEGISMEPVILDARAEAGLDGVLRAHVDFLAYEGELVALELSTDATGELPPAIVDLTPTAYGSRRGTVSFALRSIPGSAREIRLALLDSMGRRSEETAVAVPLAPAPI
jgi:hypothetical protein